MKELCSQCENHCWFIETTDKLVQDHNKYARKLGMDTVVWPSDLLRDEIQLVEDTERQIEQLRDETVENCPNYTHIPDFIGRWMVY